MDFLLPAASATLLLLMLLLGSCSAMAESCIWEAAIQNYRYSFNLAGPVNGFVHGARSEDGFYKIVQKDSNGDESTFWFQLCEHMKFNHEPPICQRCEDCGGPDHCGETCSALEAVTHSGFSLCKTLGYSSTTTFSFIDKRKPEQGLIVDMAANTSLGPCSFSVSVFCKKNGREELPKSVTGDSCRYTTVLKHPVGCPAVTRLDNGGLGWFSTLLIVLLCLLAAYMIAATIYRRKALGIVGLEAVPHLDFWRSIPSNIQWGVEYVISKVTSLYRRVAEPSYMRVNE